MNKTRGHGHRRQPPVNIPTPGKVTQAWSALFPQEWRRVGERVMAFDAACIRKHPRFCRQYVPGEAYPKHDPAWRYVTILTHGNQRARCFSIATNPPTDVPFVELPDDLRESGR